MTEQTHRIALSGYDEARALYVEELAQMSPEFVIDWTLKDNTVRTLIREEMVAVGIALGMHVQTQFTKAQALRLQIETASTPEQVAAVVW